jgi:hypothetical protein
MNKNDIIAAMDHMDGETVEQILREIGMEDQMLRQLVMKSKEEDILTLLEEKKTIQPISQKKYVKKFECIKGIADKENINVICVKGDIVILESTDEGEVLITSVCGFSEGYELSLTPSQFVESFEFQEIICLD